MTARTASPAGSRRSPCCWPPASCSGRQLDGGRALSWLLALLAAVALIGAVLAGRARREGWAFALTGVTIALAVTTLFATMYPDVMPSSTDPAFSLTIHNASSTHYTLTVMTVVALIMTPVVLLYQGWTYWVFRARIMPGQIPTPPFAMPRPRRHEDTSTPA